MCMKKAGAMVLLLLVLSGCADADIVSPEPAKEAVLSVSALFQSESGAPLQGSTAQFSIGESSYLLDGSGTASISGLPRSGELLLTLFDQQQEIQGAMTLSFSEGAVTDATTGDDGVGHITVRNDINEVALIFVLEEDGALRCALLLSEDSQQEET